MALIARAMFPEELYELSRRHDEEIPGQQLPLPEPWLPFVHPEGEAYFCNPQRRLFTYVNPHDPDNATALENAAQQLGLQLAEANFPDDVITVVGFTKEMRKQNSIGYYLIRDGFESLGCIGFSPQAFSLSPDYNEDRFESLLESQYWKHVQYYPSGTIVDLAAERDLVGRLISGQLGDINRDLTPFSAEECRTYLSLVERNRDTEGSDHRMAEIGRLRALICMHLHRRKYGGDQVASRTRYTVYYVPRRAPRHNELLRLLVVDLRPWLQKLADLDGVFFVSCAYSILLATGNNQLGCTWPFIGGLLLLSIAATLLLRSISPRIYSYMESAVVGIKPDAPIRNSILTGLLTFNLLGYGLLLSLISHHLDSLERVLTMVGVVMANFVLALPPIVYVLRANNALAENDPQ